MTHYRLLVKRFKISVYLVYLVVSKIQVGVVYHLQCPPDPVVSHSRQNLWSGIRRISLCLNPLGSCLCCWLAHCFYTWSSIKSFRNRANLKRIFHSIKRHIMRISNRLTNTSARPVRAQPLASVASAKKSVELFHFARITISKLPASWFYGRMGWSAV